MSYKNIEVLFISSARGELKPLKFKIVQDDDLVTVKLHNPIFVEETRHSGFRIRIYDCQAESNGYMRPCKIGYQVDSCTWMLMRL